MDRNMDLRESSCKVMLHFVLPLLVFPGHGFNFFPFQKKDWCILFCKNSIFVMMHIVRVVLS